MSPHSHGLGNARDSKSQQISDRLGNWTVTPNVSWDSLGDSQRLPFPRLPSPLYLILF
jgi:hypothetical protein